MTDRPHVSMVADAVRTLPLVVVGVMMMVLPPVSAQEYDDWIKDVPTLGLPISFNCTDEGIHPRGFDHGAGFDIVSWMLPSFDRIEPGSNRSNIRVSDDGFNLTIDGVQKEQLGVYHCMRRDENSGEWSLVKWGLNMRGPYFENLWQKYQWNVIIGLAAGGGFTVLATAVLIIYAFRWRPPAGQKIDSSSTLEVNYKASKSGSYDYREDAFPSHKQGPQTAHPAETYRQYTEYNVSYRRERKFRDSDGDSPPEPLPDYPQDVEYYNRAATGDDGRTGVTAF